MIYCSKLTYEELTSQIREQRSLLRDPKCACIARFHSLWQKPSMTKSYARRLTMCAEWTLGLPVNQTVLIGQTVISIIGLSYTNSRLTMLASACA